MTQWMRELILTGTWLHSQYTLWCPTCESGSKASGFSGTKHKYGGHRLKAKHTYTYKNPLNSTFSIIHYYHHIVSVGAFCVHLDQLQYQPGDGALGKGCLSFRKHQDLP